MTTEELKAELLTRGLDSDKVTMEIEAKINRHIEEQTLPCPFCGSDEIQLNDFADGSWTLDCHTCGAGSGTNEKQFVLKAWNQRLSRSVEPTTASHFPKNKIGEQPNTAPN